MERKIPEREFRKLGCLARIPSLQELPEKTVPFASLLLFCKSYANSEKDIAVVYCSFRVRLIQMNG